MVVFSGRGKVKAGGPNQEIVGFSVVASLFSTKKYY
jgi:hypothetical protein